MTGRIARSYKQRRPEGRWDAILIGSGIGSLATAAVLANAGRRVLVLERHYTPGGFTHVFRRKRFEWDVGLHYVGGVHREGSGLRRIFDWLSRGALRWEDMGDVYDRVRFGDEVFDLPKGTRRFVEALSDRFPGQGDAIQRYVDEVYATTKTARAHFAAGALPEVAHRVVGPFLHWGFRRRAARTTHEVLSSIVKDPRLRAVLTAQFGDYGLPPRESSFAMHAMVASHYFQGGAYPVGGSARIAETILPRITDAGGALFTNAEVEQVLVEGGRAVGVRMADDGAELRAPVVVSGAGALASYGPLLPDDAKRGRSLGKARRGVEAVGPSCAHACLYVGLDRTAAELGLPRANWWIYPDGGWDHDANVARFLADPDAPLPVAYVSFPSAKDPDFERRYPGRATIEVITLAPWERFARWESGRWRKRGDDYEAEKGALADRLLAELLRVEPSVEGHVEHAELSTPLSTRHFTGYAHGEIYGLAHSPARFQEDALRPRTPIHGYFLTGQDVATCGIGGAVMGGLLAGSAVLGRNVMGEILGQPG